MLRSSGSKIVRALTCRLFFVSILSLVTHASVAVAFRTPFDTRDSRLLRRWRTTTVTVLAAVDSTSDDNTPPGSMVKLENPTTGQKVTLIGTAHLSQKSNDQVTSVIETVEPDVVMIELDSSRLDRIGLTLDDLGTNICSTDDISPPLSQDDLEAIQNRPWWGGLTDFFTDRVADFARQSLTNMYEDAGKNMGKGGLVGGGEFLAAIKAAKSNDARRGTSTKIVLGDRSSVTTIKRAIELAIRGGDPIGVLGRLASTNQEELDGIEEKLRKELKDRGADESELNVAIVETIKSDENFRNVMFERLEREVPEFTRAFVTERDFVMSEAIRREKSSQHLVAVVGLAHVPGISARLRDAQFQLSMPSDCEVVSQKFD